MSKKYLWLVMAWALVLLVWSPWITEKYAEEKVRSEFQKLYLDTRWKLNMLAA
jgi:hypothetical protein